jgi:hypothetical protein
MPNEEPNIPGSESDLLLQLVSALINHGQPLPAQPALNPLIAGPQQLHGLTRGVIQPYGVFSGYGATPGVHPFQQGIPARLPQQQQQQQLPHVSSSMDLEASDHYDDPQYSHHDRGHISAVDKRERVRLKNRLAQQRFRERRRTIQRQAQDQFDAIAAEYDAVEMENDALREEEQALIKLCHVKCHFHRGMLQIKHRAMDSKNKITPRTEIGSEDKEGLKDRDDKSKDEAGVADEKTIGSTIEKSEKSDAVAPQENPSSASVSHQPSSFISSISANPSDKDAVRDQLFEILQKWQLELGNLMENAASVGFSSEEIKKLEAATQRQLAEWQKLASENTTEYSKILYNLLAPVGMHSPNNSALQAGTVGPETLTAIVSGITDDSIAELKQVKRSYDINVDLGYQALLKWKNELLPLLVLSNSAENSLNIGINSAGGGASGSMNNSSGVGCAQSLATRHLMVGTGIAHLHALEVKFHEAISLIGPAWSRVVGPLNAALCHLETVPYLPSPDAMTTEILAKYEQQERQHSNRKQQEPNQD